MKRSFAAQLRARQEQAQKRREREEEKAAQAIKREKKRIEAVPAQALLEGFRESLRMHAKRELRAAAEGDCCGIIVWGFGPAECDDKKTFQNGLDRVLQEFVLPLELHCSPAEVFVHLEQKNYDRIYGGFSLHVCIKGDKGYPFKYHNHVRLKSNSF